MTLISDLMARRATFRPLRVDSFIYYDGFVRARRSRAVSPPSECARQWQTSAALRLRLDCVRSDTVHSSCDPVCGVVRAETTNVNL